MAHKPALPARGTPKALPLPTNKEVRVGGVVPITHRFAPAMPTRPGMPGLPTRPLASLVAEARRRGVSIDRVVGMSIFGGPVYESPGVRETSIGPHVAAVLPPPGHEISADRPRPILPARGGPHDVPVDYARSISVDPNYGYLPIPKGEKAVESGDDIFGHPVFESQAVNPMNLKPLTGYGGVFGLGSVFGGYRGFGGFGAGPDGI